MGRIAAVASWLLGSLGVVLLALSVLLIPQNQALAAWAPPICMGISCNTAACTAYYTLNGNCPGSCKVNGLEYYCKCVSDATNCQDCVCRLGVQGTSCDCGRP